MEELNLRQIDLIPEKREGLSEVGENYKMPEYIRVNVLQNERDDNSLEIKALTFRKADT